MPNSILISHRRAKRHRLARRLCAQLFAPFAPRRNLIAEALLERSAPFRAKAISSRKHARRHPKHRHRVLAEAMA